MTPLPGGGVGRRLAQPIRDLVARVRERHPCFGCASPRPPTPRSPVDLALTSFDAPDR